MKLRSVRSGQKHAQRGVVAVEFSLLLPILAVLTFGIVEFGMAFYRQSVLAGAVREGARAGILALDPRPSSSDISTRVRDYLDGMGWDPSQTTVVVSGAGGPSGSPLQVEARYPTSFSVLSKFVELPGLELTGGGKAILTATVVMQLE